MDFQIVVLTTFVAVDLGGHRTGNNFRVLLIK